MSRTDLWMSAPRAYICAVTGVRHVTVARAPSWPRRRDTAVGRHLSASQRGFFEPRRVRITLKRVPSSTAPCRQFSDLDAFPLALLLQVLRDFLLPPPSPTRRSPARSSTSSTTAGLPREFESADKAYADSHGWTNMDYSVNAGYYDNRYWVMWKLPMYGCTNPEEVLAEIRSCTRAFPECFIRVAGFDNIKQVQCSSFLPPPLQRPHLRARPAAARLATPHGRCRRLRCPPLPPAAELLLVNS